MTRDILEHQKAIDNAAKMLRQHKQNIMDCIKYSEQNDGLCNKVLVAFYVDCFEFWSVYLGRLEQQIEDAKERAK